MISGAFSTLFGLGDAIDAAGDITADNGTAAAEDSAATAAAAAGADSGATTANNTGSIDTHSETGATAAAAAEESSVASADATTADEIVDRVEKLSFGDTNFCAKLGDDPNDCSTITADECGTTKFGANITITCPLLCGVCDNVLSRTGDGSGDGEADDSTLLSSASTASSFSAEATLNDARGSATVLVAAGAGQPLVDNLKNAAANDAVDAASVQGEHREHAAHATGDTSEAGGEGALRTTGGGAAAGHQARVAGAKKAVPMQAPGVDDQSAPAPEPLRKVDTKAQPSEVEGQVMKPPPAIHPEKDGSNSAAAVAAAAAAPPADAVGKGGGDQSMQANSGGDSKGNAAPGSGASGTATNLQNGNIVPVQQQQPAIAAVAAAVTAEVVGIAPPGASGTSPKPAKSALDKSAEAAAAVPTTAGVTGSTAQQTDASSSAGPPGTSGEGVAGVGAEVPPSQASNPAVGKGAASDAHLTTNGGFSNNDATGSVNVAEGQAAAGSDGSVVSAPNATAPSSAGDTTGSNGGSSSGGSSSSSSGGKKLKKSKIPKEKKGAIVLAGAPENDGGKKGSIFSQLSTKIKILERNMSLSERFLEQMRTRYAKINLTLSQEILVTRQELKRVGDVALNAANASCAEQSMLLEAQQFVLLSLLEETSSIAQNVDEINDKQSKPPLLGLFAANIRTADILLLVLLLSLPSMLTAIAVGCCVGRMFRPPNIKNDAAAATVLNSSNSKCPSSQLPSAKSFSALNPQAGYDTPRSRCAKHGGWPDAGAGAGVSSGASVGARVGADASAYVSADGGHNNWHSPSPIQLSLDDTFQVAQGTQVYPQHLRMSSAPHETFGFYSSRHSTTRRDSI